jgi:hypothetical protein
MLAAMAADIFRHRLFFVIFHAIARC